MIYDPTFKVSVFGYAYEDKMLAQIVGSTALATHIDAKIVRQIGLVISDCANPSYMIDLLVRLTVAK